MHTIKIIEQLYATRTENSSFKFVYKIQCYTIYLTTWRMVVWIHIRIWKHSFLIFDVVYFMFSHKNQCKGRQVLYTSQHDIQGMIYNECESTDGAAYSWTNMNRRGKIFEWKPRWVWIIRWIIGKEWNYRVCGKWSWPHH